MLICHCTWKHSEKFTLLFSHRPRFQQRHETPFTSVTSTAIWSWTNNPMMRTYSDPNDKLRYRYIGNSHLEFSWRLKNLQHVAAGVQGLAQGHERTVESGPRCAARILRLGALLRRLPVIHHVRFLHHWQSLPSADEKSLDHWLSLVFEYLSHLLVYQGLRAAEGKTEEGEGEERGEGGEERRATEKREGNSWGAKESQERWRLEESFPQWGLKEIDIGVTKGHNVVLKWRV